MERRESARDTLIGDNRRKWLHRAINLRESRLQKAFRLIAEEPPGRFLDLGCGAGEFSARFRALGWRVCGGGVIEAPAARGGAQGIQAGAGEVASGLPFLPEAFDLVFAGELIEPNPVCQQTAGKTCGNQNITPIGIGKINCTEEFVKRA